MYVRTYDPGWHTYETVLQFDCGSVDFFLSFLPSFPPVSKNGTDMSFIITTYMQIYTCIDTDKVYMYICI